MIRTLAWRPSSLAKYSVLTGKRYKLTLEGLKEAHRQIDIKATVGKIGLGVDDLGEDQAFC